VLQAVAAWLAAGAGGTKPGKLGLPSLGLGPAQCNAMRVILLKVAGIGLSIRY